MAYFHDAKAEPVPATTVWVQPRQYPNDYKLFTIWTAVICGFFSPLTLLITIPAYCSAQESYQAAKKGDLKTAWRLGVCAAYLNVTAIVLALLVAALCIGLVLSLYDRDR